MADLRQRDGMAALALSFAIFTAARTSEVLGARWDEIDRAGKVWIVPAARMKSERIHRVPLTDSALAILDRAEQPRRSRARMGSYSRATVVAGPFLSCR